MTRLWIVSGLVTGVSLFAGGYWTGQRAAAPQVVTTARSYSKGAERAEELHKVVVTERTRTTKKPDGTIVTDVVAVKSVNDEHISQSEHETLKVQEHETSSVSSKPDWRVSVLMPPKWPVASYSDLSIEVSRRVLGPVSVGVQVSGRGTVQVGVSVDF